MSGLGADSIKVIALWLDEELDYIGVKLEDGTLGAMCSNEKWRGGLQDSLRSGWAGNFKLFTTPKVIHNVDEEDVRENGLIAFTYKYDPKVFGSVIGDYPMTVPDAVLAHTIITSL